IRDVDCFNGRTSLDLPVFLPGVGRVTGEFAARVAVEHKVPSGGEDAAVDRERECDDPAGRLFDRIECDKLAVREVRTAMTTLRCELIRFQCRVLGRTSA